MRSKDRKTTTFSSVAALSRDTAQGIMDAGHEDWIIREQFELRLIDET